ncbi:hypothetical protein [Bdellovibrio sp. BCCA]|uniref:hypothetical protein n=1 Tax=Bdellovibrio sp. BCCA TaxID=3136281 RepID=UPI0030F03EA9
MEQPKRKLPKHAKEGQELIEVPEFPTFFDPKNSLKPISPLTKEEIDFIFKAKFEDCCSAYASRIRGSGLLEVEDGGDKRSIDGSAFLFFSALCKKFDKDKYKGAIGSKSVEGATGTKTLDWFFYNYFCEKLNEMSKDMKEKKKKYRDLYGDDISHEWVLFDVVAERGKQYREVCDMLLNDAAMFLSPQALELLKIRFAEGYKYSEAKGLVGKSYYAHRTEMMNYINIFMLRKRVALAALLEVSEDTFYKRIENRLRGRDMMKILGMVDRYTEQGKERRDVRRYVRLKIEESGIEDSSDDEAA